MLEFPCAGCERLFRAEEHLAGRRIRCKGCGAVNRVPSPGPLPPPLPLQSDPLPALGPRLATAPAPEAAPRPSARKRRKPRSIDRDAWIALAIGAGMAAIALAVPLIGFVLDVLQTVVHELGHTATAWLFGSPAVPSFDLTFGGGVSHIVHRQPMLIVAIYGVFAYLAFRARDDRTTMFLMLVAVALYSVAAFTPLREVLIAAMGHGAELLIAGIFLYRALSGNQVLRGEERPLYAFIGLYLVVSDALFAYRLMASHEHREAYADAKGGGHAMDFSRIAEEYLHVRLEAVAACFLLACALPLIAAFLSHRYGRRRGSGSSRR